MRKPAFESLEPRLPLAVVAWDALVESPPGSRFIGDGYGASENVRLDNLRAGDDVRVTIKLSIGQERNDKEVVRVERYGYGLLVDFEGAGIASRTFE